MRNFLVCSFVLFPLIFAGSIPVHADTEYQQSIGLIHMDSEVSGGENTLAMLAAVAKNAGADMAIVTDHDTQKATYGIWPLRNLLRVSHSRASVRKYGISKYLREIDVVDRDLEDFHFLPGIEAVPYYNWDRDPFNNALFIRNLHRHMLVMGLDEPGQIEKLPSIEAGYPERFTRNSLFGLLWLIPLLISFILFKPAEGRYLHYGNWFFALFSNKINLLAMPVMVISVVFLFNNFPFREPIVNQYKPDAGARPYQEVIDYVNREGGLIYWAHPEASYEQNIDAEQGNPILSFALKTVLSGGLNISTAPYFNLLNDTKNYTGFAIFFEGYHYIGNPEGLWDILLLQFCKGTREHPVWAISELDMEEGTDPEIASASQTVFLVREKTKEEYLEALRVGRMYCFTNNLTHWVTIRDYSVNAGGKRAISGEVLKYEPDAYLTFDIELQRKDQNFMIVFIKDGNVFSQKKVAASEKITIPLSKPSNDMGYVRAIVYHGAEMSIATNPIFFTK